MVESKTLLLALRTLGKNAVFGECPLRYRVAAKRHPGVRQASDPKYTESLRPFASRGAADRAAGEAGERGVIVWAVVLDVEVAAAGSVVEVDDNRFTIAFVAAGKATHRRAATGSSGCVTIAIALADAIFRVLDVVRLRAVILLHFALTGERIFRRVGSAVVEAHLWRVMLRGACDAVTGIRNRFEPGSGDGVATPFTIAKRAVGDSLQSVTRFGNDVLFIGQEGRVHIVQELVGAHIPEVEWGVREFTSAIAARAAANLIDHAARIGANARSELFQKGPVLRCLLCVHGFILVGATPETSLHRFMPTCGT